MNKLVVHHTYINGMAFDSSGNRNHGIPYSVTQSPPPFAPAFSFDSLDSRIVVNPSASLEELIAVRVVVSFNLSPAGGFTRRYNLVEGEFSFALFVQPDGSLMGTILDANGNWSGATSAANLVSADKWHRAELRHDGVNQSVLMLDGVTVATSYNAQGPVRSVGPRGIAVGHWPEPQGLYTFEGNIRELWVYKYDPLEAAKDLLDPCCMDRVSLDKMADRLREKGYTAQEARSQGMDFLKFALKATAQARGTDAAGAQKQINLANQAFGAFLGRNEAAYNTAIAQLAALAGNLSVDQMLALRAEEEELIKKLSLPLKDWQKLIQDLCWSKVTLDPNKVAAEHEKFTKADKR